MDATASSDSNEIREMVLSHFLMIREHPKYVNTRIRVYIEANMSFVSSHDLAQQLEREVRGLTCARYDPKHIGRVGIWTTHATKERWAAELRRCIGSMSVVQPSDFITSLVPDENALTQDVSQRNIELFCEQLHRFRKITAVNKRANEDSMQLCPKFTYGAKGAGKKDDRVAAACICIVSMIRDVYHNDALQFEMENQPMLAASSVVAGA